MDVTVRRAKISDIATIQEFGSKLLNFECENYDSSLDRNWAFSDEARTKYLDAIQNEYVSIAEIGSRPAGFLIGRIIAPTGNSARPIKQASLQNIYVDEDMRKNGLGKKLIEDFKRYCKNNGVIRLNVSVLAANMIATNFYYDNGFKPRSLNLFQELWG